MSPVKILQNAEYPARFCLRYGCGMINAAFPRIVGKGHFGVVGIVCLATNCTYQCEHLSVYKGLRRAA